MYNDFSKDDQYERRNIKLKHDCIFVEHMKIKFHKDFKRKRRKYQDLC